ncbi:MAG TPA: winged helix-turn-helix domain-containing protein [Longimicrobium sp.]|nr:winged helix-turn-helix domain-containing protein [Longimicrobium sp.]
MTTLALQREANRRAISAEWARIGGGFTVEPARAAVDVEDLLVRSAVQAPADARLFAVAATWLSIHHHLVDMRRLGRMLEALEGMSSAAAGAMLSVANEEARSARLAAAERHCRPLAEPRVFFEQTAASPVLSTFARDNALPVFARWGLWHDELSLKPDAVRPVGWILEHCPELRIRALLGAGLDGEIVEALRARPRSIAELAREAGTTYAATHEATARLVARGLVEHRRETGRTEMGIPAAVASWLDAFPDPSPSRAARTRVG